VQPVGRAHIHLTLPTWLDSAEFAQYSLFARIKEIEEFLHPKIFEHAVLSRIPRGSVSGCILRPRPGEARNTD